MNRRHIQILFYYQPGWSGIRSSNSKLCTYTFQFFFTRSYSTHYIKLIENVNGNKIKCLDNIKKTSEEELKVNGKKNNLYGNKDNMNIINIK